MKRFWQKLAFRQPEPDVQTKRAVSIMDGNILIYTTADGDPGIEVRLEDETVWLSQSQMADLFGTTQQNISLHIRNVYKERELDLAPTHKEYLLVRQEGKRQVRRPVDYYNLDVIISVGYRVKSQRGTQFRIWANKVLKDHLIQGYSLNEQRLREKGFGEIEAAIRLLNQTLISQNLIGDEGRAVLEVVTQYARSWRLLLDYDENRLAAEPAAPTEPTGTLTAGEARAAIAQLKDNLMRKGEASALFGQGRGEGLEAILGNIEQTFGGEPLYPSVEAKAAHLLYFVIKDHPFADGNKRIGSFLFLRFLDVNGRLKRQDGTLRIESNGLVALALLIAASDPGHKPLLIRLIQNLIE